MIVLYEISFAALYCIQRLRIGYKESALQNYRWGVYMPVLEVKEVAKILKERKDLKPSHGIIIYLFEKYLESLGLERDRDYKIEANIRDLDLDIVIFDSDGNIKIVWEVIGPEEGDMLSNSDFREILEKVMIRTYAYVLKPKYIVLTDGFSLFVYNDKGERIEELSTHDLCQINSNFEQKIRKIILSPVETVNIEKSRTTSEGAESDFSL